MSHDRAPALAHQQLHRCSRCRRRRLTLGLPYQFVAPHASRLLCDRLLNITRRAHTHTQNSMYTLLEGCVRRGGAPAACPTLRNPQSHVTPQICANTGAHTYQTITAGSHCLQPQAATLLKTVSVALYAGKRRQHFPLTRPPLVCSSPRQRACVPYPRLSCLLQRAAPRLQRNFHGINTAWPQLYSA